MCALSKRDGLRPPGSAAKGECSGRRGGEGLRVSSVHGKPLLPLGFLHFALVFEIILAGGTMFFSRIMNNCLSRRADLARRIPMKRAMAICAAFLLAEIPAAPHQEPSAHETPHIHHVTDTAGL